MTSFSARSRRIDALGVRRPPARRLLGGVGGARRLCSACASLGCGRRRGDRVCRPTLGARPRAPASRCRERLASRDELLCVLFVDRLEIYSNPGRRAPRLFRRAAHRFVNSTHCGLSLPSASEQARIGQRFAAPPNRLPALVVPAARCRPSPSIGVGAPNVISRPFVPRSTTGRRRGSRRARRPVPARARLRGRDPDRPRGRSWCPPAAPRPQIRSGARCRR